MLDSPDVGLLVRFYAELLRWNIDFINEKTCGRLSSPLGGTRVLVQLNERYERPVWPEKEGSPQQQAHLDIEVNSPEEMENAVAHAVRCGAVKADCQFGFNEEKQRYDWVTMADPVGHPFCFVFWKQ